MNIRIEAAITDRQWVAVTKIRTEVFAIECGFTFTALPRPGTPGVWHFLATNKGDAIGTLSIVDTTGEHYVHKRYGVNVGENDRVARYSQLAIRGPYRRQGIFEMLLDTAQGTVVRPNGFAVGWLLYPAAHVYSSVLTTRLGFSIAAPPLDTEYGRCCALVRKESNINHTNWAEEPLPTVETCPV